MKANQSSVKEFPIVAFTIIQIAHDFDIRAHDVIWTPDRPELVASSGMIGEDSTSMAIIAIYKPSRCASNAFKMRTTSCHC